MRETWDQESGPAGDPVYEAAKRQLIESQRRQAEFVFYLQASGLRLLRSSRWQEKVNRSGVTLSRHLLRRAELLRQLGDYLNPATLESVERELRGAWDQWPDATSQLAEQQHQWQQRFIDRVASQHQLLNSCVEDWGIYVAPNNNLFANYLDNYWSHQSSVGPDSLVSLTSPVDSIIGRRLEFDWARFEPTDYDQLTDRLQQFYNKSDSGRARAQLGDCQRRWSRHYRLTNHQLRRVDRIKFDQLRAYYRNDPTQDTEVDSDYFRDILRLESLFLVDGDPMPDWQPIRLSRYLELVADDDQSSSSPAA